MGDAIELRLEGTIRPREHGFGASLPSFAGFLDPSYLQQVADEVAQEYGCGSEARVRFADYPLRHGEDGYEIAGLFEGGDRVIDPVGDDSQYSFTDRNRRHPGLPSDIRLPEDMAVVTVDVDETCMVTPHHQGGSCDRDAVAVVVHGRSRGVMPNFYACSECLYATAGCLAEEGDDTRTCGVCETPVSKWPTENGFDSEAQPRHYANAVRFQNGLPPVCSTDCLADVEWDADRVEWTEREDG